MRGHGTLLASFAQHVINDLTLALLTTSIEPFPILLEQSTMFCRLNVYKSTDAQAVRAPPQASLSGRQADMCKTI